MGPKNVVAKNILAMIKVCFMYGTYNGKEALSRLRNQHQQKTKKSLMSLKTIILAFSKVVKISFIRNVTDLKQQ